MERTHLHAPTDPNARAIRAERTLEEARSELLRYATVNRALEDELEGLKSQLANSEEKVRLLAKRLTVVDQEAFSARAKPTEG